MKFILAAVVGLVACLSASAQVKQAPKPPQAPPLDERVVALEKAVAELKADVLELKTTQAFASGKPTEVAAAPKPKPAESAKPVAASAPKTKTVMQAVQTTQMVCVNGVCQPRTITQMVPVEVAVAQTSSVKEDDFVIPDDQPPDVAPQPDGGGFIPDCPPMTARPRLLGTVRSNGTVVGQPLRNAFRLLFGRRD